MTSFFRAVCLPALAFAFVFAAPESAAQASSGMTVLSHLTYPIGTTADVWASGDIAYVARRGEGITVLNTANPSAPAVLYNGRPELFIQDVKTRGNLLACSNESGNGRAVYLFDVTNPANPTELGFYGTAATPTAHNCAFYNNFLYCCSPLTNQVFILDITNPAAPVAVGGITSQAVASLIHDVAVVGNRLYLSWLHGGFEIHDLSSNPANPTLLAWKQVPASFVHNTWPLADGIHVATTDEISGGYLTIWDVSNPSNVQARGQWRASALAVMHNLIIADHYAFITNYTEGVRVVDVSNVNAPVEAAFYDTFTGVNALTFGAWGIHPLDQNRVLAADFNNGLWIFDFEPITASLVTTTPTVGWGQTIDLSLGASNVSGATLPLHVDLSFSIAQLGPGSATLLAFTIPMPPLSAALPYPILLPPAGPPGPFDITFTLSLLSANGILRYDHATAQVVLN